MYVVGWANSRIAGRRSGSTSSAFWCFEMRNGVASRCQHSLIQTDVNQVRSPWKEFRNRKLRVRNFIIDLMDRAWQQISPPSLRVFIIHACAIGARTYLYFLPQKHHPCSFWGRRTHQFRDVQTSTAQLFTFSRWPVRPVFAAVEVDKGWNSSKTAAVQTRRRFRALHFSMPAWLDLHRL